MTMHHVNENVMLLTAASPAYADSLLALLGSLNCNWPDHPPVLVYDLGLKQSTLDELAGAGIQVCKVPAFCPHWRRHFTWKIWAFHHAPCRSYLWLDAGICVLQPIEESVSAVGRLGYFAVPNGLMLNGHMTPGLQRNMGIGDAVLRSMPSISGGCHGFAKEGRGTALLDEALALAMVEENLMATAPRQFHEQTLLTVLLHKYFSPVLWADRHIYGLEQGGILSPDQRMWCHRRAILPADVAYYRSCLHEARPSHLPTPPPPLPPPSLLMRTRVRIAKLRGRYPEERRRNVVYDGVRD